MGKGNAQKTAQARERNAAAAGKDKDKGGGAAGKAGREAKIVCDYRYIF